MVSHIRINPSALSKRWLCYVDLLGFKDLVQEKGWIPVFAAYSKALETIERRTKEACKKACKQKIEQQESPDGLYLYEIEQAIDSAEIK